MTVRIVELTEFLRTEIEKLGTEIQEAQIELNLQEDHCRRLQDNVYKLRTYKGNLETAAKGLEEPGIKQTAEAT